MNRLKELRQGKKLTQQELAQEIGVSKLTILNWEKGEHQIKSEYDETNRKNGKRDLALFVKAESLPVIEQDIKDLILEEWKKTQPEDNYEEIDGTLSDNISRIYIALGQLPILFQDFFGSFLTLSKSDKKIVMQLVNSLYEKNKDIGIIKDYTDKK